jgi:phosphatidate cytidylyltransferase
LVILPLLLLFIHYAGSVWFAALVTLVAGIALHEFYAMSLPEGRKLEKALAIVYGGLLVPLLGSGEPWAFPAGMAFAVIFFGLVFLWRFQDLDRVMSQLAQVLFGFCYVSLLIAHMILARALPHGREWIYLVLLVVMACDTSAYFSGISLGRHKLYPAISPNKSIEGAVGGLVGSLAGAFVARSWFFPALTVMDCLLLGLALGILGQLGDLFESMVKRAFQVKDSGTILPGHGGMLDRLDSLLFAFPMAFYYGLFLV